MEFKVGDFYIATTINQTIQFLSFHEKKGQKMAMVEIIRNGFAGEHEIKINSYREGLKNTDIYEKVTWFSNVYKYLTSQK